MKRFLEESACELGNYRKDSLRKCSHTCKCNDMMLGCLITKSLLEGSGHGMAI